MPCKGRKFITDFLLPSLNTEIFGAKLKWLDVKNKVFQMQWNHKSASNWTESDAAVFAAWDKRRGHYKPDDKEYYTKSKQRFRAVLYKFIKDHHITELCSKDKYTKIYCIGKGENLPKTAIFSQSMKSDNDSSEKISQYPEDTTVNGNLFARPHLLATEDCTDCTDKIKQQVINHEGQIYTGHSIEEIRPDTLYQAVLVRSNDIWNSSITDFRGKLLGRQENECDIKTTYIDLHMIPEMYVLKNENNNLKQPKFVKNFLQDFNEDIIYSDNLENMELFAEANSECEHLM